MLSEFIEKKRIGKILIEQGYIKPEQLQEGLKKQVETRELIGQILMQLGHLTEEQLVRGLAIQFGVKYTDLEGFKINEDLIRLLPDNLIKMYWFLPVAIDEETNTLTIVASDPTSMEMFDSVKVVTGYEIEYLLSERTKIEKCLHEFYQPKERDLTDMSMDEVLDESGLEFVRAGDEDEEEGINSQNLAKQADQKPIIKLVNKIILTAINKKASDIHIEAHETLTQVRYRIDGTLYDEMPIARKAHNAIISRIKVMSELNIAERRIPQDGNFSLRIGATKVDFRISILPSILGENCCIRILSKEAVELNLSKLGFNDFQLKTFIKNIEKPYGLTVMTGPTGSGKTTTLYSALTRINVPEVKIITVENPVEFQLARIHQVQVFINKNDPSKSLTFASGLRSILRHDPDVVMIGEIRDDETAEITINAALTGHLVFSTIHANNAIDVISRMSTLGVVPYLLSSAMNMVVAQRLVRRICTNCKEEEKIPREFFEYIHLDYDSYSGNTYYHGKGCQICNEIGYKGRAAIYEILDVTEEIREMIIKEESLYEMRRMACSQGMSLLRDSALEKALEGVTTMNEVKKFSTEY